MASHSTRAFCLVVALALLAALVAVGPAAASALYSETFHWWSNGSTFVVNNLTSETYWIGTPADTGRDQLLVKVQEDVTDDAQGRAYLEAGLGKVLHGSAIPTDPINLYSYTITNVGYGDPTGLGKGVAGLRIPTLGTDTLGQWAPTAAVDWWKGETSATAWSWNVDADMDGAVGDGTGLMPAAGYDNMLIAVAAGTPHTIAGGNHIYTWDGEEPTGEPTNLIQGYLSRPIIPEPGTLALLCAGLGGFGATLRRRRRRA